MKPVNPHNLPEARSKWICEECGHVSFDEDVLTAPNPFNDRVRVSGCPHCKSVEPFVGACMYEGCEQPSSGGHPGGYGYRYFWACWKHSPNNPASQQRSDS